MEAVKCDLLVVGSSISGLMAAAWVNEAARAQRLQRIEKAYAEQVQTLRAGGR